MQEWRPKKKQILKLMLMLLKLSKMLSLLNKIQWELLMMLLKKQENQEKLQQLLNTRKIWWKEERHLRRDSSMYGVQAQLESISSFWLPQLKLKVKISLLTSYLRQLLLMWSSKMLTSEETSFSKKMNSSASIMSIENITTEFKVWPMMTELQSSLRNVLRLELAIQRYHLIQSSFQLLLLVQTTLTG